MYNIQFTIVESQQIECLTLLHVFIKRIFEIYIIELLTLGYVIPSQINTPY